MRELLAKLPKKERRKFIQRMITSSVALIVLVAAAFAWYVNNKNLTGNDMKVMAHEYTNVIIGEDPEDLKNNKFDIDFDMDESKLLTARHDSTQFDSSGNTNGNYTTGLVYNSNSQHVSVETGLSGDGTELLFEKVEAGDDRYYADYPVYLASMGYDMRVDAVNVTAKPKDITSDELPDYFKAASMDLYLVKGTKYVYKGTLNLAGLKYDDSSKKLTSVDLMNGETPKIIPNGSEGSLTILVRMYFDGGLLDPTATGKTFVHAKGLELEKIKISVTFEAVEPED